MQNSIIKTKIAAEWAKVLFGGKYDYRLTEEKRLQNDLFRLSTSAHRRAIFIGWLSELPAQPCEISSGCGILAQALHLSKLDGWAVPPGLSISYTNEIIIKQQDYDN